MVKYKANLFEDLANKVTVAEFGDKGRGAFGSLSCNDGSTLSSHWDKGVTSSWVGQGYQIYIFLFFEEGELFFVAAYTYHHPSSPKHEAWDLLFW